MTVVSNTAVCYTGHATSHAVPPTIPLSVSSRLEEDSVPNFMPCHMQPMMHEQLVGRSLVGRSWVTSSDERVASRDEVKPSVSTGSHKTASDVEDVKKQAPVSQQAAPPAARPHTDKVDTNTQTG